MGVEPYNTGKAVAVHVSVNVIRFLQCAHISTIVVKFEQSKGGQGRLRMFHTPTKLSCVCFHGLLPRQKPGLHIRALVVEFELSTKNRHEPHARSTYQCNLTHHL